MRNSTLFSALRVLGVAAGFLTLSHFTQAQTLKTASGTANNFILTLGQNLGGSYPAGLSFTFISNQTITGAATLNVNGTGAINLVKNVNKPLVANDILAGQAVQVLYDGTNFQVLNVGTASTSTGAGTGNLYTFIATANVAPVPSYPSGGYGTNVIVYDTELYDTDNSYDPITGKFQPTSPGYYFLSGSGSLNGLGTNIAVGIFKNGVRYKDGGASFGASGSTAEVSSVVYANGTTDYFQIYMYNNSGSTQPLLVGNTSYNYFSGFKINGGGTLTVTSFSGSTASGISTLNGLTTSSQSFTTSSTGTSVNIISSGNTHNFNIPLASVVGGNNITVTGSFPLYTISGLAGGMSTSQWVSTTNGIYYGNNIGIGVAPTANDKLTINNYEGNGTALAIYGKDIVGIGLPLYIFASTGGLNFGSTTYGRIIRIRDIGTSNNLYDFGIGQAGNLFIQNNANTNSLNSWFSISSNGGVGINNSNPITQLDVNGNARFTGPVSITGLAGATTQALGVNNLGQLVTIAGGTSTSQWSNTTTGIYYNNGTVEIGQSSLATDSQLKIYSTSSNQNVMTLESNANNNYFGPGPMLQFRQRWWTGNQDMIATGGIQGFKDIANGFFGGGLKFYTMPNGGPAIVERMFLNNAGQLGIATSTPGASLDVNGNSRFLGPVSITGLAGATTLALGVNNLGQLVTIAGGTSTSQWVSTTGGIFYPGNIGIGAVSGIYAPIQLDNSLSKKKIVLWDGNGSLSNTDQFYGFGIGNSELRYQVDINSADHVFYSAITPTTSLELMRIKGSGNIGIGTSAPGANLDVNGNARFVGPVSITGLAGATTQALGVNNLGQLVTITGGTGTSQWVNTSGGISYPSGSVGITLGNRFGLDNFSDQFLHNTNTVGSYSLGWYNDNWNGFGATGYLSAYGGMKFFTNSSPQPFMSVTQFGLIGINTTAPGATLDVNGSSRFAIPMTISSFAGAGTQALGVNNLGQLVTIAGGTSTSQWATDAGGIYYNNGSVSVGTTSNATFAPLSSAKPNGTGTIRASFGATDTNHSTFMIAHPSPGLAVMGAYFGQDLSISSIANDNSSYIPLTTFKSNGFVGIATSTPGTTLDVNGNARFSGPVSITGLAGATTQALGVNSLGQLVTITGGTSTSQWVSTTNGIYYSGGNIGLKINPQTDLHLYNPTAGVNTRFETPISTGVFSTLEFKTGIYNASATRSDAIWQVGLAQNGTAANPNDRIYIGRAGISSSDFAIYRDGNVGIGLSGTGVPSEKLTVLGNISASGIGYFSTIAGLALNGAAVGSIVTVDGIGRLGFGTLPSSSTSQWVSTTGGSIFYNQGGFVGINSAIPPIAHLDVNGISVFRSTFCAWCDGVNVIGTPTGSKGFIIHEGAANATSVNQTTGRYFLGMIGGDPVFSFIGNGLNTSILTQPNAMAQLSTINGGTFNVNGRIGIATPTPIATLDVNGSARIAGNLTITSFAGAGTQALGVNNLGQLVTISGASSSISSLNSLTTTSQTFSTSSTGTSINITSSGSVHNFNIPVVTVVGGNNVTVSGGFPSYTISGLGGTSTSNWVDSGQNTTHTTGGKVGINASNPFSRLEVRGNNLSTSTSGAEETVRIGSTDNTSLRLGIWMQTDPNPNNQYMALNAISAGNRSLLLQSTGGNVGIGPATALPNEKLTVQGNISVTGTIFAGTIVGNNLAGAAGSIVTVDGFGRLGLGSLSATSSSQWVTTTSGIYSPVNAAIGTAPDPTFNFKVAGNQSGPTPAQLVLQGSTDPNQQLMMGYNTQSSVSGGEWGSIQAIKQFSGPVPLVLQNYGGNVGIGTNNPLAKLTVNGNASISGITTVGGLNVRNLIGPGTVTVDGLGRLGVSTSGGSSISGSGTTNGVAFWSNGTTLTADGANFVYTPSAKSLKVGNAILSSNSSSGNVFFGANVGNQTMSGTDNNFFGTNIGQNNTSGKSNNFLGREAGFNNILGEFNNYLGEQAGYNNQIGSHNNAMGFQAGYGNASGSGSNNNSFGQGAGLDNEGDGNNFIGTFAGSSNTSGNYNNFIGQSAGTVNTTGSDNIFIGQQSGLNNSTGSNNVAIGKNAGLSVNGLNNSMALGAFATVGGSNMIALGGTGSNSVNVGIGTGLPQNTIDVVGGARIRNLSISGAVFANANGDLYVSTIAGASSNLWTVSGSNLQPTSTYGVNLISTTTSYKIGGVDVVRYLPRSGGVGNNILLGGAGNISMTGDGNVLIGDQSGISNTSGSYNSFVGYAAGMSNTIGDQNTFIGRTAGRSNTSGGSNTFIGNYAGWSNVSGSANTYNGWGSGTNNLGTGNSYFGYYSGINSTAGSYNSIFGYFADIPGSAVNSTAIGAYATVLGSNMMALGAPAGSPFAVNVGIGTGLPQNTIDVVGGARIRNLSVSGAVFANANGDLYISTVAGGTSNLWTVSGSNLQPTSTYGVNLTSTATSYMIAGSDVLRIIPATNGNNILVGGAGNPTISTSGNVLVGQNAGSSIASGGFNTFVGDYAGTANSSGGSNTFYGFRSGASNNSGSLNTFIGYFAGNQNTSGGQNTFMGVSAGNNNSNGFSNTFIGNASGALNNIGGSNSFVGSASGNNNTSGSDNAFHGFRAGFSNSVASGNSYFGSYAGHNSTGANNTAIGFQTDITGAFSYAIALGAGASVNGSNMMAIGGAAGSGKQVSVGIGTGLPQNTLDVVGGARIRNLSVAGAVFATSNGDLYVNTATSSNLWTVSGTALTPSNSSYGLNLGTNTTSTGLVNISSTTSSGLVVTSTNLPSSTGAIMAYSYSSSSAGLGAFVYGTNSTGLYGEAANPLSAGITANNSGGGTALRATANGSSAPVVQINNNGATGTALQINLQQGLNTATGLLISSPSPTSQAMDISGKIQFRNYTSGTLTVDGLGNLGVTTVTSNVGPGAGFLAVSTTVQSIPAAASWNTIQFLTEQFDDANAYSTVTYDYTAPTAGVYQVNASVPFANIGQVDIAIVVGLTNYVVVNSVSTSPTTGIITSVPISGIIKLAANQKVNIQIRQFTGQSQNTASSGTGANASFSMVKLY